MEPPQVPQDCRKDSRSAFLWVGPLTGEESWVREEGKVGKGWNYREKSLFFPFPFSLLFCFFDLCHSKKKKIKAWYRQELVQGTFPVMRLSAAGVGQGGFCHQPCSTFLHRQLVPPPNLLCGSRRDTWTCLTRRGLLPLPANWGTGKGRSTPPHSSAHFGSYGARSRL